MSRRPTRSPRSGARRTGRHDGPTGPSQRQLRVGEALRHPLAEVLAPPISVVSQPVSQIGQEAGRLLLERLAGEQGPPRRVRLKTALTVRGSSGGPRS